MLSVCFPEEKNLSDFFQSYNSIFLMLKDKLNLLKKRPSKIVCEVYSFIITGKYL